MCAYNQHAALCNHSFLVLVRLYVTSKSPALHGVAVYRDNPIKYDHADTMPVLMS